ncbi:MAG: methyltransferase type 11 [Verrucomicrobia bacterium]|nr:methyltransferase type 11 [Verrucomicrobiota bacterium]
MKEIPLPQLRKAAEELSERYRTGKKPYLTSEDHYYAYLAVRFPATLAAITRVLQEANHFSIETMLDLGAGPGTGWIAAKTIFAGLKKGTLIEADPRFIALGKQQIEDLVVWKQEKLPCTLEPHDLVLLSYSLGEMPQADKVIEEAWKAAQKLLIVIEPGTPGGYARIIRVRTWLLSQGASIVAPCPHQLPCPMQGSDWCHFPARVERTKLHKQLKSGTLGFEDEKFSYLIVSKDKKEPTGARLVAAPKIGKGHVQLTLCTEGKIVQKTVTQKEKDLYKRSRKLSWGDKTTH